MRDFDEIPGCSTRRAASWSTPTTGSPTPAFPDHLSFDWGDTYRIIAGRQAARRAGSYHTLDSFIEIQTDTVSEAARVLLAADRARPLVFGRAGRLRAAAERRRQVALERLAAWNGEMSEHMPEPLIYAAWLRALTAAADPGRARAAGRSWSRARTRCSSSGSTATSTAPRPGATSSRPTAKETCTDMARLALDDALIELPETYGDAAGELALGRCAPGAAPDTRRWATCRC